MSGYSGKRNKNSNNRNNAPGRGVTDLKALLASSRLRREEAAAYKRKTDRKMIALTAVSMLFFVVLVVKVAMIMQEKGDEYTRQVLSQQQYSSVDIPFKRGSIKDRNGLILAQSEKVYKVIFNAKQALEGENKKKNLDTTLDAINDCFGISESDLKSFMADNPTDQYKVIVREVSYTEKTNFEEYVRNENRNVRSSASMNGVKVNSADLINEAVISFEPYYKRNYPNGSLASDVLGYVSDSVGRYGLEGYYESTLCGNNGREYGYLTDENALERTVIPAENGATLVTTLDAYVQQVCENVIRDYNEEHANEFRENEMGSENTGVIIMDVHTGEVLAMASYPYYNPNDPKDLSMYSEETVSMMKAHAAEKYSVSEDDAISDAVSAELWKNFCIQQSYEPGSVCKTFTVATGLDIGAIHDGDTYDCGGYLKFGDGHSAVTIRCHNRYGDGTLTVKQALEKSCNVSLMKMGQLIGKEKFLEYNRNFGFGLKTNIDLEGEMVTSSLVFNERTMGVTELMTSTFGQGYNVTMIETVTAFSSLVNGGYLYQPHMVKSILNDDGSTLKTIEPVVVRQVVSKDVSDLMIDYCTGVVDEGTGTAAQPAGYRIGGKTGTAEHSGKGKVDYTVSFMGFAPAADPQIAIYVVIDRPNTPSQEHGTHYACLICRDILNQVLPYLNIPRTELVTQEMIEEQNLPDTATLYHTISDNEAEEDSASENEAEEEYYDEDSYIEIEPLDEDVSLEGE